MIAEEIKKAITRISSNPMEVCYIVRYDGEGYKVEEIDGNYCHGCAAEKARRLDKELGGSYYHQVHEETSPEADYFECYEECGCQLNAELIMCECAEASVNGVVADITRANSFNDLKGDAAWRIEQVLCDESEARTLFPKQMRYIDRRLANLYTKTQNH